MQEREMSMDFSEQREQPESINTLDVPAVEDSEKREELKSVEAAQPRTTVVVEGLSKHFKYHGETIKAVDDVSFSLTERQLISVTGPSGSGKTTLLYMLGALDHPTEGSLMVDGVDLIGMDARQENIFRRKHVGFVFQGFHLIPNLTALENVMLPMELAGANRRVEKSERARELLLSVGIDENRHKHRQGNLSAGQQQRVAIARALANNPSVLLADEPTGNLDSKNGRRIVELLHILASQGHTIVMVTHDRSIAGQGDTWLELTDGRVEIQYGRNGMSQPATTLKKKRARGRR
jgi:ABC-type lipoprotein export system ATPase subunit